MSLSAIRQKETIVWCATDHLPDVDETVMVTLQGDDEPVWLGFFDGTDWVNATTGGSFYGEVIAWAPMPSGFTQAASQANVIEQLEAIGQQRLPMDEHTPHDQEHAL